MRIKAVSNSLIFIKLEEKMPKYLNEYPFVRIKLMSQQFLSAEENFHIQFINGPINFLHCFKVVTLN